MSSNPVPETPDTHKYQTLVPYIDPENPDAAHEANAAICRKFPVRRNIFLLLANSPGLFGPFMGVLYAIFNGKTRTIPLLEYQLVVLRVAGSLDSEYEFEVNEPVARVHGMPAEKIEALRKKSATTEETLKHGFWTERERCVIKLVDEQLASYTNAEETILEAQKLMSNTDLVEILMVLGVFAIIARVTRALKIDSDGEIPGLDDFIRVGVTKNARDPHRPC